MKKVGSLCPRQRLCVIRWSSSATDNPWRSFVLHLVWTGLPRFVFSSTDSCDSTRRSCPASPQRGFAIVSWDYSGIFVPTSSQWSTSPVYDTTLGSIGGEDPHARSHDGDTCHVGRRRPIGAVRGRCPSHGDSAPPQCAAGPKPLRVVACALGKCLPEARLSGDFGCYPGRWK